MGTAKQYNDISLAAQCNEVEREMIPFNNVTRDTVLQISIDQCYAKERFWQEYEYIRM